MLFQKWLLQYSNSGNAEKWRRAVTTEFRVKPSPPGRAQLQHKNVLLLRKSRFLDTSSASPVDRSFTLRNKRKPSCTPKWIKLIQRHHKENRRATWNAEQSFIWGTLFSLQGGKGHNRSNRYSEYTQESHGNTQKWLRVVEHLHKRYCYLLSIILSIILTILLPVQSPDSHCSCINHKNLYQNNLNTCWSEYKLIFSEKEELDIYP